MVDGVNTLTTHINNKRLTNVESNTDSCCKLNYSHSLFVREINTQLILHYYSYQV